MELPKIKGFCKDCKLMNHESEKQKHPIDNTDCYLCKGFMCGVYVRDYDYCSGFNEKDSE